MGCSDSSQTCVHSQVIYWQTYVSNSVLSTTQCQSLTLTSSAARLAVYACYQYWPCQGWDESLPCVVVLSVVCHTSQAAQLLPSITHTHTRTHTHVHIHRYRHTANTVTMTMCSTSSTSQWSVTTTDQPNLWGKVHYFVVGFWKYTQFHSEFREFENLRKFHGTHQHLCHGVV